MNQASIFDRFSSMEGEAGSEGDSNRKRGSADDNSDENRNEGSNSKIANSNDGQGKPKRQMKTPFQLETLEKAYACSFFNFYLRNFICVFVFFISYFLVFLMILMLRLFFG